MKYKRKVEWEVVFNSIEIFNSLGQSVYKSNDDLYGKDAGIRGIGLKSGERQDLNKLAELVPDPYKKLDLGDFFSKDVLDLKWIPKKIKKKYIILNKNWLLSFFKTNIF